MALYKQFFNKAEVSEQRKMMVCDSVSIPMLMFGTVSLTEEQENKIEACK